ncbi:MAG: hypothetical protein H7320_19375 [Ferruginibacter sp.]|nr:hypothetical protein [Ferruginibacter sp.]
MDKALTEQEEILKTRTGIRLMKLDVIEIRTDLTLIKTAIVGNELTQDGGLVKRMYENESRVDKMDIRINEVEKEMTRRINEIEKREGSHQNMTKTIWTIGGAILLVIATAIASKFIK